ncbi:hypothetical protein B0H14DRAFT_3732737 [Mycena olivaceomarginata]|nr:hypothetical protein B0H14DRAFT_3732737 [Mycena olivaceomarginata]
MLSPLRWVPEWVRRGWLEAEAEDAGLLGAGDTQRLTPGLAVGISETEMDAPFDVFAGDSSHRDLLHSISSQPGGREEDILNIGDVHEDTLDGRGVYWESFFSMIVFYLRKERKELAQVKMWGKGVHIAEYASARATSALSCMAGRREPLAYIPEIPAQLQSSPQVTVAAPPTSLFPPAVQSHLQSPIRSSSCPATPSPHALRTFRALTLSRSRGRHTASEVNGYVDAVTQEHEKERERLRRARERDGGSPRLGRANTSGTVATTATPYLGPLLVPASSQIKPHPLFIRLLRKPIRRLSSRWTKIGRRLWSRISHPSVAPTPVTLPPAVVPAEMQPPPQIPQAQGFDPFDSQSYMDIDLAMNDFGGMGGMIDMGMGINFGMGGGGDDRQRASAMDFKTDFTDDDFSFFDRPPDVVPSAPLRMPSGVPSTSMLPELHPGAGLTPAAAGVHQCGAVPSAIGTQSAAGHGNTTYDCNDFIDGAGRRRRAA